MKIKAAVIGTGHLGSIHLKIWKQNPDVELVGFYDTDAARAEQISKEHSVKYFSNLEELISLVDAVTIAVPTVFHYETAKKCIDAGVHCLIEKPITSSYPEALELIKLAEKKSVLIQVGHVERFMSPLFIEVHRLSQFKPRATDVSVIHDLMIHDIDIMLSLIKSKVKQIQANGVAILTETPDIANARITFENGAVANLTASRISARPMRKMRVFQNNAYISIDFGKQDVEVYSIKEENESAQANEVPAIMLGTIEAGIKNKNIFFEKPPIAAINAIEEEQKAFVYSIENKLPTAVTAQDAAEALKIAEEINTMVIENMKTHIKEA